MPEIYGTYGPACEDAETLEKMFRAGMTGIRLNLSHTSLAQSQTAVESIRLAAGRAGKPFRFLIDMQGPELRIGVPEINRLDAGQTVALDGSGMALPAIVMPYLTPGQQLLIDDGKLAVTVEDSSAGKISGRVDRGGELKPRKSVALPGCRICPPALTGADRANIALASGCGVTDVMQPFVRGRDDLVQLRAALDENGCGNIRIMAKIENSDGLAHLEDFMEIADEICIARGDLGNAVPLWQLPAVQKRIAAVCRRYGKPFTVATQMLASMENSPVPTRAEVCDIFNAVLDGGSVMVTGETAAGHYPVEVIRYLSATALEAERSSL